MTKITVLTVSALDVGIHKTVNYMAKVCKGYAVKPGHIQKQVKYPASLDPSAGNNPKGSIAIGAQKLNALIMSTTGPKIVLGYSQGAQVAGTWLRNYAPTCPIQPSELSFLLIGNPERRYGKQPWTKKITPDTTQYKVRDVSRRNDNWSDYSKAKHGSNKLLALFGSIHTNYWATDPYDPKSQIIETVGNTSYVIVP
jgi:hypothetical protein